QEVAPRVAPEPLLRADAPEPVVHLGARGILAKDLVAEGNRVVEEPPLDVQLDGALVGIERLGATAEAHAEVSDAVEERDVRVVAPLLRKEHLLVHRERLVELSPL